LIDAGESAVRVAVRRHHHHIALRQRPRHRRHHVQSSATHRHQHVLRVSGSQRLAHRRRQHARPAAVSATQRVDTRRAALQAQQLRAGSRRRLQHPYPHRHCRRQVNSSALEKNYTVSHKTSTFYFSNNTVKN